MLALVERQAPFLAHKAAEPDPGRLYEGAAVLGGPLLPIPRPQRYDDFARAYGLVAWVYIAVARKGRDVTTVPLRVMRRRAEQLEPVPFGHPLAVLLRRVNPFLTAADLLEATSANLDLVGNAYWLVFRDTKGAPVEIWPLRPDRVEVIPGPDYVSGYRYTVDREVYVFAPEQVIHTREFSPWHDHYGQGALTPAWDAAQITRDAHTWNRSLLANSGRLDGLLVSDQPVSAGQAKEAADRYRELFAGPKNVGRLMVLGKGLKYQTIATTPKELDFVAAMKLTREEILSTFGVRPVIVGLEAGDIGRRSEQIRDYFYSTVRQRVLKIAGAINEFLVPMFGDLALEVVPDIETALLPYEDRLALAQADASDVTNRILLPNEVRRRRGLPPVEGGDTFLASMYMVPVSQVGQFPAALADQAAAPTADAPKGARPLRALKAPGDQLEFWREFARVTGQGEARVAAGVRRAFQAGQGALAAGLAEGLTAPAAVAAGMAVMQPMLVGTAQAELPGVMASGWGLATRVMLQAATGAPAALEAITALRFDLEIPGLAQYLAARPLVYADQVGTALAEEFRGLLAELGNAGRSVPEMAAAVAERFAAITEPRALLIARTEVVSASNQASLTAYQESGVVAAQEWLTARDGAVRPSHQAAEGQRAPLGQPFQVGAAWLRYPGDPAGPIEEIANCRCTTIAVLAP